MNNISFALEPISLTGELGKGNTDRCEDGDAGLFFSPFALVRNI